MKAAEQRNSAQLDTQALSFEFCSTVRYVKLTLVLQLSRSLSLIYCKQSRNWLHNGVWYDSCTQESWRSAPKPGTSHLTVKGTSATS